MKNLFRMDGKVVIVTGGAGYLGSAMAEGLLEHGAVVVAADIVKKRPDEILSSRKTYKNLYSVECDLSNTDSIKNMFKKSKELCGKINILINNVNYGVKGNIEDMTDEEWNRGIDGSVSSQFRCTREVIPYIKENNKGAIINIASMYGMVAPDPRNYENGASSQPPNYGSGKAGVLQFTRYCAAYLAKYNIRVNSITPGPFPKPNKIKSEKFIKILSKKTMLGRIGVSRDIAGAAIFLASSASDFITGANIVVDGGWTAW